MTAQVNVLHVRVVGPPSGSAASGGTAGLAHCPAAL